jgi:hypothetical protein
MTAKATTKRTELEQLFAAVVRQCAPDLPPFVEQYAYVPGRKFTADFAWPSVGLLIFCEGGVFGRGAHGSVEGILKDVERSQHAAAGQWRVFRVTSKCLEAGRNRRETLQRLRLALGMEEV